MFVNAVVVMPRAAIPIVAFIPVFTILRGSLKLHERFFASFLLRFLVINIHKDY